jgi:hypothetical protein
MNTREQSTPSAIFARSIVAETSLASFGDGDVTAMAAGLVRAYGIEAAACQATEQALAELDDGNPLIARTWRRVLNAVHRLAASDPEDRSIGRTWPQA